MPDPRRHWIVRPGVSARCSKATKRPGSELCCSILRVSILSPVFLVVSYAGVIAVPLPAPNLAQPERTLPRLRAIISDAQPTVVLTTSAILSGAGRLFAQAPELQKLRWVATDKVPARPGAGMAWPGGDQRHRGVASIHVGLHRGAERRRNQPRQPPA